MKNFEIIPFQNSDLGDFQNYLHLAFHKKYILGNLKFLKWQFQRGVLYLAKDQKRIVGHFGFQDIPYKVYDQIMNIRVLMNLFVLESYRLSGISNLLVEKIFNTSNSILVSGYTPLAQKLYPHFRGNWQEAGNLSRYFIVLDPQAPLLAYYKIPFSGFKKNSFGFRFKIEEFIPSDLVLENLWQKIRNRYPITVERTPAYLHWRFFTNPFLEYKILSAFQKEELLGYLIYRCEEDQNFKIARIIDFVTQEEAERSLLCKFLEKAKKEGAAAADFMFSGDFYRKLLEEAGFFEAIGTDWENFPILFSPLSRKKTFINIAYDLRAPLSDCYFTKADGDQDRTNPV